MLLSSRKTGLTSCIKQSHSANKGNQNSECWRKLTKLLENNPSCTGGREDPGEFNCSEYRLFIKPRQPRFPILSSEVP